MNIRAKYELIEPLPGEGPKSFRARQSSLRRDVTVHMLEGGETPENQGFMARLRALPPDSLARIVEVGPDDEGTQFVVTLAPPFQHLPEWIEDQERAAAMEALKLTRAGVWKVPATTTPASPPGPPPAPLPSAISAPAAPSGAFDDMFREPPATPTGQMMAAPAMAQPPAESEPGEFTRMFQAPAPPASTLAEPARQGTAVSPASPVAAGPGSPAVPSQPGEFTRLFQAPATPAAAPAPPAPTPAASGSPGEFTRMFQAPMPSAPAEGPRPSPPTPSAQAGEFTRMFQSPAPAPPPESRPQGGEFTRFFQAPPPGTQGPPLPAASGFPSTPGAPLATPPAPRYAAPSGATQAFAIPAAPQQSQAPGMQAGPSEYTRMTSLASIPGGPATAPAPPAPGPPHALQMPSANMPSMPYANMPHMPGMATPTVPQPPAPQFPMPAAPPLQASAPATTNTLLLALVGIAMFLAGGLIVFLLMRR